MPDIEGNTTVTEVPVSETSQDPVAQLQAQIKKFETEQPELAFPDRPKPITPEPVTATAAQETVEPATPTEEGKAPEGKKVDVPSHMRLADGTVDEAKLQKATQHIEKAILSKEEQLTKYKELQKKYTQLSQEVATEKTQVEPPKVDLYKAGLKPEDFSPEFRDKLQKDMEQDFVGTWLKATTAIVKSALDPLVEARHQEQAVQRDERIYKRLDELASKPGNEWVLSDDGMGKFDTVFKQRPYLWQSTDPYGDAYRFIDDRPEQQVQQGQSAQAPKPTPILGAGRAVPPVQSQPSVSSQAQLEKLNSDMMTAMATRDFRRAAEIQREKDRLVVSRFGEMR
jgi:hypothetical protein